MRQILLTPAYDFIGITFRYFYSPSTLMPINFFITAKDYGHVPPDTISAGVNIASVYEKGFHVSPELSRMYLLSLFRSLRLTR